MLQGLGWHGTPFLSNAARPQPAVCRIPASSQCSQTIRAHGTEQLVKVMITKYYHHDQLTVEKRNQPLGAE